MLIRQKKKKKFLEITSKTLLIFNEFCFRKVFLINAQNCKIFHCLYVQEKTDISYINVLFMNINVKCYFLYQVFLSFVIVPEIFK